MEWQTKASTWDFDVLQAESGAIRRTQGSDHQWGLQDDGAVFPSFGTIPQKGHFPTPSSSGTTAGSLDSASSGFPDASGNCSNGLLLGPCPNRDTGKVRNGWLFADKEMNAGKWGLPRVASGLESEDGGAAKHRLRMVEKGGNCQGFPENTPAKVDVTKEFQVIRGSPAVKRMSREEAADQGGPSRGATLPVSTSPPAAKKHRSVAQGVQVPRCQVEGCRADLTTAKDYHRRHKVCAMHSRSPKVITSGIEQRFCQQCSRFHVLSEFDDAKRSCRKRLAGHNERRRKSSQDTTALSMASILQDDPRHLNAMLDRSYFMQYPMAIPLSIHDNGEARRAWLLEQQLAMACRAQLLNGDRLPYASADRLMMILQAYNKGTTMAVPSLNYSQGSSPYVGDIGLTLSSSQSPNLMLGSNNNNIEAAAAGLLDSGRALSLLSSQALPTSSSHHAALEKFIDHNTSVQQNHENYPPHITPSCGHQSAFPLADFSLNQQKLLSALPSSHTA